MSAEKILSTDFTDFYKILGDSATLRLCEKMVFLCRLCGSAALREKGFSPQISQMNADFNALTDLSCPCEIRPLPLRVAPGEEIAFPNAFSVFFGLFFVPFVLPALKPSRLGASRFNK